MDEDEVNERNVLRQVLEERCAGAKIYDDDINKLVAAGFSTAAALTGAPKEDLVGVLPGRPGVVGVLRKAFGQPAAKPPLKKSESLPEASEALRDLLEERCAGAQIYYDDINKLVAAGYSTAAALAVATKGDLDGVLPGRPGVVGLLLKAFWPPTDSPLKKTKRSLDEVVESAATSSYFNELLEAPGELPSSVEDLQRFLSQKSVKLPVLLHTFLTVKQPDLVTVTTCAREETLAHFLAFLFFLMKQVPGNEAQSSAYLSNITGDFLKFLDENAPTDKQLRGLETTLDSTALTSSESTPSALVRLKRPDFQLYVSETLLLRWENKLDPADCGVAVDENVDKLKVWSPLYYGELPYVIGGSCGGRLFQWLMLSPRGEEIVAEPISIVYDLKRGSDGALFLHSIIRMHCLLQKLQDKLTSTPPLRLYKSISRGDHGGLITFYPDFVAKELVPALGPKRVEELQSMYDAIKESRHLIQLCNNIQDTCSKTILTLKPVGHPFARPRGLEQLRNAMHDLLHALDVLHKEGYTHRDLRWPNCVRVNVKSEWKWMLIDLECGGRDGAEWEGGGLVNWDVSTLEDCGGRKVYTKRSDMYELGKLLVECLGMEMGTLGNQKRNLRDKLKTLGDRMQKERAGAAQMLTEFCPRNCERCAKFEA